jgi:amino-acid N-acetyltransferase|uniref:GNAT family N-acetyltransferase n=1 Tax=Schlesneria paludicola TaxID=360056 RepID=A0A7C4QTU0_9PLAN
MTVTLAPPYTIRPTRLDDVPRLQAFIAPFVDRGRLLPRTVHELEELMTHGFVVEDRGQIVGFAALEVYSPKLGEIRSLAVDPQHQGRGIGKALVEACIHRAKALDVFEVLAVTSAEEFFRKCGFDFTLPGEKKALFYQTRKEY